MDAEHANLCCPQPTLLRKVWLREGRGVRTRRRHHPDPVREARGVETMPDAAALAPQRWERPLDFPPGFWKRQLPTKVLAVAAKGDVAALRALLSEHPDTLNRRGSHNRTLLWEAVRRGKLDAVRWLVEQGAEVDATGCVNGESYI